MRIRIAIAASTPLALGAINATAAQGPPAREELLQLFSELIPPDTTTQLQDFRVNGFHIQSSRNKELGTDLWHVDRWYRLEVREGRRGIIKDGAFIELERRNNRYYVP